MQSLVLRRMLLFAALASVLTAQTANTAAPDKPAPDKPAIDKPAIDKAKIESWARHMLVWGEGVDVTLTDPQPADVPGFSKITVHGSVGNQSHEETFLISADGQNIIRGSAYNVAQNPFKPELSVLDTKDQPGLGTVGAPVVISIYSDFQCPYCKEAAKVLRANLLQTYPKEVRLYFHDFPLSAIHPWANAAAQYGRCIYRQNPAAFWLYHDWIFEQQKKITADTLRPQILEFVKGKGVEGNAVDQCFASGMAAADIERTEKQGRALEVSSTPTLFINGRRMVGVIPWETLKTVIDFEIEYQKTAKNAGDDCGCSVALPVPGNTPAKLPQF